MDAATEATTDYYNCNFSVESVNTAELNQAPDGDAFVAALFVTGWKEYLGACLTSPMVAGKNYQLTFNIAAISVLSTGATCYEDISYYSPVEITIFGSSTCLTTAMPISDSPDKYDSSWKAIGKATYTPASEWSQFTINFTPLTDVNAIMIGAPENLPSSYPTVEDDTCSPYFLFDNLLLNESSLFGSYISAAGTFCDSNLVLTAHPTVPLSNAATYQWYKNGVAIIGATQPVHTIISENNNLGVYAVKITDGTECYISTKHTVNGQVPAPNIEIEQPDCITNTGKITVATTADQYSFDNGITWSNSAVSQPLTPGIYEVKIKYNSGCTSRALTCVLTTENFLPWPYVQTVNPTCAVPGSITITSAGAEFSFDNGQTWSAQSTKFELMPGSYNVLYKNAQGCLSRTLNVELVEVTPWQPMYDITHPKCNAPGSITVITPGRSYSFDGGITWQTSPVKNDLPEGVYEVMYIDEGGCESYTSEVYLFRSLLDPPEYTQTEAGCSGGNITITTPAAGYSFDGGVTWTSDPIKNDLPDGYYSIMIKNAEGCVSYNVFVYVYSYYPAPEKPQLDIEHPSSCTVATGKITITSAANEYSFDGGATWQRTNAKDNLNPGTYIIKTKNEYGCQSEHSEAIIAAPAGAPPTPVITVNDPTCEVATGSITITTNAASYSFDNGITWIEQNKKENLIPGSYHIVIKNREGCISSPAIAVVRNDTGAPQAPGFTVKQPNCHISTGVITTTSNADAYSFDNGNSWGILKTSPALGVGNYYIKVKNAAGCESPASIVVITPDIIPLPIVQDVILCKDIMPVALSATGENLRWYDTPSGGVASITAPVPQTNVPGETTYFVTQAINNCESERVAIKVTVIDVLPSPEVVDEITYCQHSNTLPLTATGTNLQWYKDPFGGSQYDTTPAPSSAVAGTFIYYVSQSAYGCESKRAEIKVTILPAPAPPITQNHIIYQHFTPPVPLSANGSDLKWYNSKFEIVANAPLPLTSKIGKVTYYVSQTVNGCESPLAEIIVETAKNDINITYPPFFTPNGDGYNEQWNIDIPKHGIKASVIIFDRYGKIVGQVFSPGPGWDGTLNGYPLPATDYWFKVIYTEYGEEKTFMSHFSLIR